MMSWAEEHVETVFVAPVALEGIIDAWMISKIEQPSDRPPTIGSGFSAEEEILPDAMEAWAVVYEVSDRLICTSAEAAQRVTPEANLGLKEIQVVVAGDDAYKASKFKTGKLADKSRLYRIWTRVEAPRMIRFRLR